MTAAARKRLAAVVERYKPEASARTATSATYATGLELAAVSLCREDLERARMAFDGGHWNEALRLYSEIQTVVAQVAESAANGAEARSVYVSAVLGQVGSLLNLQDVERARQLVEVVDDSALDVRQRSVFARTLVELKDTHRARAVLDAAPLGERENTRWKEASALVELSRGNVPDDVLEREPSVLYALAHHRLVVGEVAKAATAAFDGLAKDPKNSILSANLVSSAMVALIRTVFEDDLADNGIAIHERADVTKKIAVQCKLIFATELPPQVRMNLLEIALNYASSLRERELYGWIASHSDQAERDRGQANEVRLAFKFAEKGELTKALELMPRQAHPWRSDLMRAQLLRVAGDQHSSLELLNSLVAAWPGRVPIHIALAELLVERRQFDVALIHAEAAHRDLPTSSMALMFARCLVELEQGARALQVLENVETTERAAELRAYAADQANDSRAIAYWSHLLSYDASDANAKLRLAAALIRSGDIEGAAQYARELLETSIDTLGRDQLAACGQMLSMVRFLPTSAALIQQAAEALRTRFAADDKAEMLRLTLLASLGFPNGPAPVDYERLARAGHIKAISPDDAAALIRDRTALVNSAHTLYREGWLDAETLCQVTGIKMASLVVGWSKAATLGRTPLRAATIPGLSDVDELVRGREFLCSALELLLLQRSGALTHASAALGDGFLVT
ncbi:MAG TPA: hypothetical protein VH165_24830, partial [Kofleriaceae bacterium]|nr:hypothetical protein [Kofleriaceae bacterium]